MLMCGSKKNPYPPHGRPLEIPRGRGVLEEMYENKLEFPGGGGEGAKQKTFRGGSMDIFWNCTIPSTDDTILLGLWRWLPLRLSKLQSLSPTVPFRTTLTQTITLDKLLILLGSIHLLNNITGKWFRFWRERCWKKERRCWKERWWRRWRLGRKERWRGKEGWCGKLYWWWFGGKDSKIWLGYGHKLYFGGKFGLPVSIVGWWDGGLPPGFWHTRGFWLAIQTKTILSEKTIQ